MTAEDVARAHYRDRLDLSDAVSDLAQDVWRRINPADLDSSWQRVAPELLVGLTGAQLAAARTADTYTDDVLEEQALAPAADAQVAPAAFAGVASDGRPLDSLLVNAVTTVKIAVAAGVGLRDAMAAGYANLDMIVRTQLADAGRVADQVAFVARPAAAGYVRRVAAGACSRCVVLAGRWYRWNASFDRHPRCHCVGVPSASAEPDDMRTNPRAYFDGLTRAEQDKAFTIAGAQAIRDGADIGQVVNARRGAYGLAPAGARITAAEARALRGGRGVGRLQTRTVYGQDLYTTTEGTTARGVAGRALGARESGVRLPGARYTSARAPRLMPESIYKIAGSDREEALRLLRRNGYLTDVARRTPRLPRPARIVPQQRPRPAPVPTPAPAVATRAATLADRVKAGVVNRQVLSGGQNARTELLTLADGSKVVFKKARAIEGVSARAQQDAEELLPMVLRAAGLRGPGIYRPTANQLYMEYLEGTVASRWRVPGTFRVDPGAYDADQGLLLGLVDQLTDNYDRNGGNWLIDDRRNILPIDHGFAFTFYGSSTPGTPMHAVDQPAAAFHGAYPNIGRWAANDMSPEDLRELRRRLDGLRGEFDRLGRADWHSKMLQRLDAIAAHATGTKRRIR